MYAVIQEIQRKRKDIYGEHKEIFPEQNYTINGNPKWGIGYSKERFERPIQTSYKISIHRSYRLNGQIKKQQISIGTTDFYNIATGWFNLWEYCHNAIDTAAEKLNVAPDVIYDLIAEKLDPLIQKINAEYEATDEYKATTKHQAIINKYNDNKDEFAKKYDVDRNEYDFCYNIYHEVVNKPYLDKIIQVHKQKQQSYSSYREKTRSNYNSSYDYSKLFSGATAIYSDTEKTMLKKFYKKLSATFHPDVNHNIDTTEEMKLINKLKTDWGI